MRGFVFGLFSLWLGAQGCTFSDATAAPPFSNRQLLLGGSAAAAAVDGPDTISNLTAWFKYTATLWQDNTCNTTLADDDGEVVGCWEDASTEDIDATQGTASKKCLFKTGIGPNGEDGVRCDGSNDLLDVVNSPHEQTMTTIVVFQSRNNTDNGYLIGAGSGIAGFAFEDPLLNNDTVTNSDPDGGAFYGANTTTSMANNTWYWVMGRWDGSGNEIYWDGSSEDTDGGKVSTSPSATIGIAGFGTFTGPVDLMEVIRYNKSLSAGERSTIATYIASEYSL